MLETPPESAGVNTRTRRWLLFVESGRSVHRSKPRRGIGSAAGNGCNGAGGGVDLRSARCPSGEAAVGGNDPAGSYQRGGRRCGVVRGVRWLAVVDTYRAGRRGASGRLYRWRFTVGTGAGKQRCCTSFVTKKRALRRKRPLCPCDLKDGIDQEAQTVDHGLMCDVHPQRHLADAGKQRESVA